jgi:decaprenylphospho-beta-D-erythro-pentofuranosid-2-ulose 2-reductase
VTATSNASAPRGAVLVLGASSPIARALARRFAEAGYPMLLAGRDMDDLERSAADLRVRYAVPAATLAFDAAQLDRHEQLIRDAAGRFPDGLAGVVACQGDLADQAQAERDLVLSRRMIDVNYTSVVSTLNPAANHFEALAKAGKHRGFIAVLSSVAGDRGRPSNYLYGSAKAAVSAYVQGMRARLAGSGIPVLTVKPGFVDTRMIYGKPGTFLVAAPERVADDVFRAVRRRKDVIYTPAFWRWILLAVRSIPEPIFKRMKS